MNLKRRIAAGAVALAVVLGTVLGVATPAQAWSYCSGAPSQISVLNGYNSQGYCGAWQTMNFVPNTCLDLGAPGRISSNWMGAVWNRTAWPVTLFERPGCDYINGPYKYLPANNSIADLYPIFLYRNVSSIYFWGS